MLSPPCGPRKWMPESPTFKWLDPSQPTKIDEDLIEFWDAIVYLVHFGPKLEVSSLRQTSVEAD